MKTQEEMTEKFGPIPPRVVVGGTWPYWDMVQVTDVDGNPVGDIVEVDTETKFVMAMVMREDGKPASKYDLDGQFCVHAPGKQHSILLLQVDGDFTIRWSDHACENA